jgi:L-aminopeptidase/D-esterase-like protein
MKRWLPVLLLLASPALAQEAHRGLTAVEGLTVGHHTIEEKPTGCTVVLTGEQGAVAAVDVRGGAPGTRETDLLDPTRRIQTLPSRSMLTACTSVGQRQPPHRFSTSNASRY